jgi:hypothetical protein
MLQSEVGKRHSDVGKPQFHLGKSFSDVGKPLSDLGKPFLDPGKPFSETVKSPKLMKKRQKRVVLPRNRSKTGVYRRIGDWQAPAKRRRAAAVQDAGAPAETSKPRAASWSAPVLWRF